MTDVNAAIAAELEADKVNGAAVLNSVHEFIGRFVAYPTPAAQTAHALWILHTWLMDRWDSTPRIAFLSPEPNSGKTRALEVTEPLVPRAVHAVNTTPAYLFRKVSDENGPPTILYDEIDTVFGPRAKDNEDVRGMLNAGHRRGATAGRCVTKGKIIETEELPAYCAVALAGLDDLPDTIMTRSVVIRMRRRAAGESVEQWRMRKSGKEADPLAAQIKAWAANVPPVTHWPEMPPGVEDRNADVWESLLAVADIAGGEWPQRAREAAVTLVTASSERAGSLGVQLLTDLKTIFADADRLSTDEVLDKLKNLPESPWTDLRGKPLDARGLSVRLRKYDVRPKQLRIHGRVVRGYELADLIDPWSRYLPPLEKSVTSVTDVTSPKNQGENVTENPGVTLRAADPLQNALDNTGPVTDVTLVTDFQDSREDDWISDLIDEFEDNERVPFYTDGGTQS